MRSTVPSARRLTLVLALLLPAAALARVPASSADPPAAPNIVVINTDDQRFDSLYGCLPAAAQAQLDRAFPLSSCPMPHVKSDLMDHGITFTQSFVTTALCCPSRATMFTGNYAHTTGVLTNEKPNGGFPAFRDEQGSTIATWLHGAGYRTSLVGKYLNQYVACQSPPCPPPPGWDDWHAEIESGDVDYYNFTLNDNGAIDAYPSNDYSTTELGQKAADFVSSTPPSTPLYLYFAPFAPHPVAIPAPGDETAFSSMPGWAPPSYNEVEPTKPQWVQNTPTLTDKDLARKDNEHRSEMESLLEEDRQIHRVVTALSDSGRLGNTLIVFTTDNGLSWGEHRYFNKKNCEYEECHRVPMVVRYDPLTGGAGAGSVDPTHPVLNLDIAPTLAEAAGLTDGAAMDGRSFLPLLDDVNGATDPSGNDPSDWQTEILGEDYGSLISDTAVPVPSLNLVRTFPGDAVPGSNGHAWKYVDIYPTGEKELYDETADPYELNNRAGESGLASLQSALASRLARLKTTSPPVVTYTSGPSADTNQTSATLSFSASGNPTRFWCSFDGSPRAPCSSPVSESGLSDGPHAFTVIADETDPSGGLNGTSAPAVRSWTVDTVPPPDPTLTSAPTNPSGPSVSFSFADTESGVSFACTLDGSTQPCSSPKGYSGLSDGTHTFSMTATDAAGNPSQNPAADTWTVDATPPDTTITTGPANPTTSTTATFSFTSSEPGSTFACSLDGGAFASCPSPKTYNNLEGGDHVFRVRATDQVGNTDPTPAELDWTIQSPVPNTTITVGPADGSFVSSTSATFKFTSTVGGSTFTCSVDGAGFSSCSSPVGLSGLSEATHTFAVQATANGQTDPTPDSRSWTVDVTPPDTSITGGPSGTVNSTGPSDFTFTSNEPGGTFKCKVDGSPFSLCSSPDPVTVSGQGQHSFQVRAIDRAGNVDPTPATRTWTVDTTPPPAPTLTQTPPNPSGPSISFSFTDQEAGTGFACSLDGAQPSTCSSPQPYSGLTTGDHTFAVQAVDPAGNASTPASFAWKVGTPAPTITSFDGPFTPTNQSQATFHFTASDPNATFSCALDGGAAAPCSSPDTISVADGSHTLVVVAANGTGSSAPSTWPWTVDTHAPTITLIDPGADALLAATSKTVKWTYQDPSPSSGRGTFALQEKHGLSGTYGQVASGTQHSAVRPGLAEGTTYCWTVTGADPAGNQAQSAEHCAGVPMDDRGPAMAFSGPGSQVADSGALDGTLTVLTGPSAELDVSFTGRKAGVLVRKGPAAGTANVFLDGSATPAKTIDLYASSPKERSFAFVTSFATVGSHTLRVVWTGKKNASSTGTDVPIDGVAVVGTVGAGPPGPRAAPTWRPRL